MGTNDFIHQLIDLGDAPFAPNWILNMRDIACGHLLALEAVPLPGSVGNGRSIINGAMYLWSKATAHLKEAKPEVKDKVIPLDMIPSLPGLLSNLNTAKGDEVLGFGEFVVTEKVFEEAVDELLVLEKLWAKAA